MRLPAKKAGFRPRFELLEDRLVPTAPGVTYEILHVPDFDQRRVADAALGVLGLPGDGAMYCVPTAAANWIAYIANHGYPGVPPYPNSEWELGGPPFHTDVYNQATDFIATLGGIMNTDPVDGTGSARPGTQLWLDVFAHGDFVVSGYTGDPAGIYHDMIDAGNDGNLINLGIGWYTTIHKKFDKAVAKGYLSQEAADSILATYESIGVDIDAYFRDGGHAVTLVQTSISDYGSIGIHDPNTSPKFELMTQQSSFSNDVYDLKMESLDFGSKNEQLNHVLNYGSGYLDGYMAIRPKFGLTTTGNELIFDYPIRVVSGEKPTVRPNPSGTGGRVVDLAIHPQKMQHPYLIAGDNRVWQIDSLTGESSVLATLEGPERLVFGGREQNLFVVDQSGLTRLSRDGEIEQRHLLTDAPDAVAWDDKSNQLIAFVGSRSQLDYYDRDLRLTHSVALPIPPADPRQIGQGAPRLGISSRDGSIWLHRDGSNQVLRIQLDARGSAQVTPVTLSGTEGPTGFSIDDTDLLYVTEGGVMKVFDTNGRPVASPFAGMPGGGPVQILRAFDSYDPRTMSTPAYRNVTPEDAEDFVGPFMTQIGDAVVITGDTRGNRIEIDDQGSRGVQVRIDGRDGHFLENIQRIVVIGGDGNDAISYRQSGDGSVRPRDIDIDAGNGDDAVDVSLFAHPDLMNIALGAGEDRLTIGDVEPPEPDMPAEFHIDAGSGNDRVDVSLFQHPDLMHIDLGAGNDRLTVAVGDPAGLTTPPEPDLPAEFLPVEFHIDAGAGDDHIDASLIGLRIDGSFWFDVHGGMGNDRISVNLQLDPHSRGQVIAEVAGDDGDDDLALAFTGADALDSWFALLDGGAGTDSGLITRNVLARNVERLKFKK